MKCIGVSAVCVAALFLSSCSLLQRQQAPLPRPAETGGGAADSGKEEGQTDPDAEKPAGEEPDELSTAVPSNEQQEAARALLHEQEGSGSEINGPENIPLPTVSADGEIPEPVADSTSAYPFPGGGGLRMGTLAPPEEAASSSDNAAPKPNSVEKRGLRSPSLPKGLPMDINGKLTPAN